MTISPLLLKTCPRPPRTYDGRTRMGKPILSAALVENVEFFLVAAEEIETLAAALGLSVADFESCYVRQVGERKSLIERPNGDCVFFDGRTRRCTVYDARPQQCRTWPFWPENMDSDVWEKEVASWCPGAGKGRLYSAEEIEEILAKKRDVSGC